MHCQTTFTYITDEHLAIAKIHSELNAANLCHLICYYTEEYDFTAIHEAILKYFPDISFHGASSCQAIMTNSGYHKGPVIAALAIFDSGQYAYGTGIATYNTSIKASVN